MDDTWIEMLRKWGGHEPAHIALILTASWLIYEALRRLVPWIAGLVRPHYRFNTLPWIPIVRAHQAGDPGY